MTATLFDGWLYGADCVELGAGGRYFSVGGRDTGRRLNGIRVFEAAGMVCDEGDAACLPRDADALQCETVELCV